MPAKFEDVAAVCAGCQTVSSHRYWFKISGDDYPELKAQVLDGSLFSSECPVCRTPVKVVHPLRYSDYSPGKRFFAYLCPPENLEASYEFIQSMPMLRSNGTRIHLVNTVDDLQKLIISYDFGLTPQETHVDQSVDSAKRAEQLDHQIDDFTRAMELGDFSSFIKVTHKKKTPWYKRLFGLS